MSFFKCNSLVVLIGLLLVLQLPVAELCAQKKRKGGEVQASATRLREAEFYFTEGEKFYILEDYAKALMYYQRTLELAPDNATVHYKIAQVLSSTNRQDDMLKASLSIENALRLEKKNKYFYLLAANIYTSLTRFEKAAQIYETMISEVPGTEEYLYELAAVYQYANKFEAAIKTYDRAESTLGVNEVSSIQKIRLYLDQNKIKEGIEEGEKLIKAFPHEQRYILGFSEVLSQKGLRNEAIQYLEKFIEQNPEAGNTKMLLAGFYRDSNQEQKARPLLLRLFDNEDVELSSKLIIMGSYNTELNQNRSQGIEDEDKKNFVLSLFEKLAVNYPEEVHIHILGGDFYLSIGKNQEAQREYLKAIETGDVNYEVWENLLYLETNLEKFDDVLKHSDQALEMFPNQRMLYYYNGIANMRKRRYPEAIASLEQAKRLSSSQPSFVSDINALLGDAYNTTKEFAKSDKAYEEALAINPNSNAVLNNYSYFLALRKENLEKAEKMSAVLVKNNPDNPTYLDTYAWVLYTRAKYKEAKKVIERAVGTGKASATHFEHYGDILYKTGDVEGAVQQWEKARGLNANSESLNKKISNRKMYE